MTISQGNETLPLISARNLRKSFGDVRVLRGADLDVRTGEVGVVMGPSGGGKSTLLKCLNLLQQIDEGEISYRRLGITVSGSFRLVEDVELKVRRSIGLVFQEQNLWLEKTVLDNLTLAPRTVLGRSHDEAASQAVALLERFELKDKVRSWAWQLSGGQRQRVAIIRALMLSPELLLLDEVTSGLDPQLIVGVLDLLQELKRDGLSMLVVTHQIDFARSFGDTGVLLADGRVAEAGPIAAVLDSPASAEAREFFGLIRRAR